MCQQLMPPKRYQRINVIQYLFWNLNLYWQGQLSLRNFARGRFMVRVGKRVAKVCMVSCKDIEKAVEYLNIVTVTSH